MKLIYCHAIMEYNNGYFGILGGYWKDDIHIGDILYLDRAPENKITVGYFILFKKQSNILYSGHKATFYFKKEEITCPFESGDMLFSKSDENANVDLSQYEDMEASVARAQLIRRIDVKSYLDLWSDNREYIFNFVKKLENALQTKESLEFLKDWKTCTRNSKEVWCESWKALPLLKEEISNRISNEKKHVIASIIWCISKGSAHKHLEQAIDILTTEYKTVSDYFLRTKLSFFLGDLLDESAVAQIVHLVRDKQYRLTRRSMVSALGRLHCEHSLSCLLDLLEDPYICDAALVALGARKEESARSRIEPFLHCDDNWLRMKAKWALNEIDKGQK